MLEVDVFCDEVGVVKLLLEVVESKDNFTSPGTCLHNSKCFLL